MRPDLFWYGKWLSQDAQPNDKQNPSLPNTCSGFVLRLGFWGPNTSSRLVFGSLGEVFHQVQYLKSTWHSPYILVYIDPLLTYLLDPFSICAIYFDLKVQGIFKISPTSEKGRRFVSFQGFQEESHRLHFSRRHLDHVSASTDKQTPPIKGVWKPKKHLQSEHLKIIHWFHLDPDNKRSNVNLWCLEKISQNPPPFSNRWWFSISDFHPEKENAYILQILGNKNGISLHPPKRLPQNHVVLGVPHNPLRLPTQLLELEPPPEPSPWGVEPQVLMMSYDWRWSWKAWRSSSVVVLDQI